MQRSLGKRPTIAESADEMLTRVRRELVGIHAAIDARTHDDKEIVPWTKRELLSLIREIRSFQEEHRVPTRP